MSAHSFQDTIGNTTSNIEVGLCRRYVTKGRHSPQGRTPRRIPDFLVYSYILLTGIRIPKLPRLKLWRPRFSIDSWPFYALWGIGVMIVLVFEVVALWPLMTSIH